MYKHREGGGTHTQCPIIMGPINASQSTSTSPTLLLEGNGPRPEPDYPDCPKSKAHKMSVSLLKNMLHYNLDKLLYMQSTI